MKVEDLIKDRGIPIKPYILPVISGLSKIKFKPLVQLKSPFVLPKDILLDLMWHSARFLKNPLPSWSGYMSKISQGDYPGVSDTQMLPIIDLDPTNLTCIFSTLSFIVKQAKHLNMKTPCVTFDLPLWIKSYEISTSSDLDICLILGGFHMMMSYMGSISTIMEGSGLDEALATVYGKNSLPSIKSGKAIARAIRSHCLTEAALVSMLLENFLSDAKKFRDQPESSHAQPDQELDEDSEHSEIDGESRDTEFVGADEVLSTSVPEQQLQLGEEEINPMLR